MKQKNEGFFNQFKETYTSQNILLSLYLKENPDELQHFKKEAEDDLYNRETLMTAMLFQKKLFTLKNANFKNWDTEEKI